MGAVAEGDVRVGIARDVEAVGVGKLARSRFAEPIMRQHEAALAGIVWPCSATSQRRLAKHGLERRPVAQHLFDRATESAREPSRSRSQLLRMLDRSTASRC